MSIALWIVQGLLALAFLMAGFMKTFMPIEGLKKNMSWVNSFPVWFVRFVGIAELLGGLGLILPKLTHIIPQLTIAAAIGLFLVMICAIVYHVSHKEYNVIGANFFLGLLAAFIAVGYLFWVSVA
jgi:putative oxidoreductase